MTNAYEVHRLAANKLLDAGDDKGGCTTVDQLIAAAQVHATLALAAATWSPEITVDFATAEPAQTDS